MNTTKTSVREQGFVSIIVAATVMILLSLITIGFTRVMQREQREALDRQLTRQATYAAESGINATWQYIQASNVVDKEKNQCSYSDGDVYKDDDGTVFDLDAGPGPVVKPSPFFDADDATAAIQVTCVLYDKTPTEIRNQSAQNEESIFPFEEKDNGNFATITIRWRGEVEGYDSNCSDGSNFEFPTSLSGTPVLKLDLYNTASFSRDNLANRASYLYLIPCDSGVSNISISGQREIYKTNILCVDGVCSVTLDVNSLNSSSFFVRHKLLYGSGEVVMGGVDQSGDTAEIKRAQTVIDVTARAADVVRRLRVHVPYNQAENIPGAVVTVGTGNTSAIPNKGLCKEIYIIDSGSTPNIRDECN